MRERLWGVEAQRCSNLRTGKTDRIVLDAEDWRGRSEYATCDGGGYGDAHANASVCLLQLLDAQEMAAKVVPDPSCTVRGGRQRVQGSEEQEAVLQGVEQE